MKPINVSSVYCILNKVTDRRYVGSTTRFNRRKNQHKHELRNNRHVSILMQKDFQDYGEESFIFFELEEVYTFDRNELFDREQYWINKYHPEYNTVETVKKFFPVFSDEARERSRLSKIGRKQPQEEKDRRAKSIREHWALPQFKGTKKISDEQKKVLSEKNMGEKNPNWGLKRTPEQLENMSKGMANTRHIFKSPTGELVEIINPYKNSVSQTGLSYSTVRKMYKGKIPQSGGWTFVKSEKIK